MKRIHLLFSRLEIDCSGPAGDTGMGGMMLGASPVGNRNAVSRP